MSLILACLFTWPTGLLVFKRFVWTCLIPPGCLVWILGTRKFIILQREQNVHRTLLSGLWPLLFGVILLIQPQFLEAV